VFNGDVIVLGRVELRYLEHRPDGNLGTGSSARWPRLASE
jgi:hypothetical protein